MNQTYLVIYDVLDSVAVLEAKLQFALEDLERNEESRKRMEVVKASQVEQFAKIRDENEELKRKLRYSQASLQALVNDHTAVTAKVSILEARAKAAKKRATQEDFIRDVAI